MLGWVLKKGLDSAAGVPEAPAYPDDTQIEQPDTPAPVFAARAFKHALFGTPAPSSDRPNVETKAKQGHEQLDRVTEDPADAQSPTKPPGILLTPGTGTTRRKRVSFGRDVKDYGRKQSGKGAQAGSGPSIADGGIDSKSRPRTRLTEALERSRKQKQKSSATNPNERAAESADPEDAWEEVEDLDRDPDITVDLNEPHSQSGKYWKSEFQKYHEEAKMEMEKLVKYKHLAKSYAQMKDSEALELNQRLKEEQEKVARMERRITEISGQIAAKRLKGMGQDDHEMMDDLARQTALAIQYRDQVKDLEALLHDGHLDLDGKSKTRRAITSPRTTKTLLDTQRELRKAREQVKEVGDLRQELRRLKADLRNAEQRELKLEVENKRIAAELSQSISNAERIQQRLNRAEEEVQRKDNQYTKLKETYDGLKDNAKARYAEAKDVLQRKNDEISELKKEVRALKTGEAGSLKEDLKSLAAGKQSPDAWAKKLADLQAKLKAEQELRQREREDASVTISRLEKETKGTSKLRDRTGLPQSRGELVAKPSHAQPSLEQGEEEDKVSRGILAEKRQPEAPSTSSYTRRPARRTTSRVLVDRAGQEQKQDGFFDVDGALDSKPDGDLSLDYKLDVPRRARSTKVTARESRDGYARMGRIPDVQAALDALRPSSSESEGPKVDLLKGRFKKLGGPDPNSSTAWTMNTSRSTLPAGRRAAAIARLEQKKAERRKVQESGLYNKENVGP